MNLIRYLTTYLFFPILSHFYLRYYLTLYLFIQKNIPSCLFTHILGDVISLQVILSNSLDFLYFPAKSFSASISSSIKHMHILTSSLLWWVQVWKLFSLFKNPKISHFKIFSFYLWILTHQSRSCLSNVFKTSMQNCNIFTDLALELTSRFQNISVVFLKKFKFLDELWVLNGRLRKSDTWNGNRMTNK